MSNSPANLDLTDSVRDQNRLHADTAIIDLPSVKDIPGQEHVHPLPAGEMADTTISSADEEGAGVLDDWDEGEGDDDDDDNAAEIDIDKEVVIGEDEIALDDEEPGDSELGEDVDFEDDEDEMDDEDDDTDVTALEKEMLANAASFTPTEEETNLNEAALDATDGDGDLLNEVNSAGEKSGSSLDIPGSELDDADEKTGEEDEENNVYSMAQK